MRRLLAGALPAAAAALVALALGPGCATEEPRDPPLDAESPLEPGEQFAFGRSTAARVSVARELVEDERARKYVARVGGVVAAASRRPDPFDGWRFFIVREEKVATYSAPCGFVFVTTGALKACANEDALAALLAQEMAHSALLHALDGEPVKDIRPTKESWPHAPKWGYETFTEICARAARRTAEGWTEAQELAASEWAKAALARSGYAAGEAAVPEVRVRRFREELAAVR